jgi:predicted ATPase/DNA-binding NarL/FixJ family response regulator/transcriptional regulator with XRE-family HTH domain
VRRQRLALDLTQAGLARLVNCAKITITKIERDERRPSRQLANLLADQLAIPGDQRAHFVAAALGEQPSDRLPLAIAPLVNTTPAPQSNLPAPELVATDAKTQRGGVEAAPRHNLPAQTTAFIGREQELADIQRLLFDVPECRLLALVGPGGIGKTRLALAAAAQALDSFADGAFFVSLAPLNEVAYIVPAIAEALHVNFHGTTDAKDQLLAYLSKRRLLLVLDNFEHLLEGANLLAEILGHAADVALLVTSRERLNLREEWSYDLQGLAFPADDGQSSDRHAETLTTYSAVQLFLQRARQAEASFVPSPEDVGDIVRICQHVEGMPLGLELAAPWIRSLSCREIAVEIERSPEILTTTLRNMPERHRSLRVVFGQTWQRLSPAEQSVLRQLAVFRGGFTREAAVKVTQATLGVLSSLVDKALVRRTNTGRFELHELVRQYAAEQLAATEEGDLARERHFATYLQHFRGGDSYLRGPEAATWLARMEAEQDNLRAALQWSFSAGRYADAARLLLAVNWFWILRGQWVEGGKWYAVLLPHRRTLNADLQLAIMVNRLDIALNVEGLTVDGYVDEIQELQTLCPDALLEAAACFFISRTFADFSRAAALLERGIALVRAAGETPGLGPEFGWLTDRDFWLTGLLWMFSGRLIEQGEFARATPLILEYQKNGQAQGSRYLMADSLAALGRMAWLQGDLAQAHSLLEQAVTIATPFQYADGLGPSKPLLGLVTLYRGDAAEARRLLNESLHFFLERRANDYLAPVCAYLAELELWEGALDQAGQWLAQSLAYDVDPQRTTIIQIERLWVAARLATAQQHFLHAATLFGLAEQVRRHTRYEAVGPVRSLTDSALAVVRKALSAELFAEAWAAGRSMPLEQAIDFVSALPDVVEPLPPDAPSSPTYPAGLTLREVEVLRLLAQGLTYAQIAGTLVVAPRTVNAHLTSIYGKLGVSSRAAATRFALDHHLA